jgi:hypothetical protein
MGSRAKPVNEAYERGFSEGWSGCLSRIEELGLEEVLKREREIYARHGFPTPLTLCFEPPQLVAVTEQELDAAA